MLGRFYTGRKNVCNKNCLFYAKFFEFEFKTLPLFGHTVRDHLSSFHNTGVQACDGMTNFQQMTLQFWSFNWSVVLWLVDDVQMVEILSYRCTVVLRCYRSRNLNGLDLSNTRYSTSVVWEKLKTKVSMHLHFFARFHWYSMKCIKWNCKKETFEFVKNSTSISL